MGALTFDTHKAVTSLKNAGFDEAQAEAVVATLGEATNGRLATKDDLADFTTKADLRTVIAELRADLYRQMWLMGASIVTLNVTLTVALVKLLP